MGQITLARVATAVENIGEADLGGRRMQSIVEKFLVLKRLGLTPDTSLPLSTDGVSRACGELFGVDGCSPYEWFDPITQAWGTQQPNGGWPVGTVWTQILRPSQGLRALIEVTNTGPAGPLASLLKDTYIKALEDQLGGRKLPAEDIAVWFSRSRTDLSSDTTARLLHQDVIRMLHLTEPEVDVLFGREWQDQNVPVQGAWPASELGTVLPSPLGAVAPTPVEPRDADERNTNINEHETGYEWTQKLATVPLPDPDVRELVGHMHQLIQNAGLVLPEVDSLLERCVVALLNGHLVLQGPPGTGKTMLARLLAKAFGAAPVVRTATADWTTYEVIGGLRPNESGGFAPTLGCVTETGLECARTTRESLERAKSDRDPEPVATWLVLDELNRADIDRAIGGLYTTLSSIDGQQLSATPVELWFEHETSRRRLWLPGRFRLVATMNDVDTSFVNALSQGLLRRFQFVYVGVPSKEQMKQEVRMCYQQADRSIGQQYGAGTPLSTEAEHALATVEDGLTTIVGWLRYEEDQSGKLICGWPLGSAQISDLWRAVLLRARWSSDVTAGALLQAFDACFADRVVPQMSNLRARQLTAFSDWLRENHSQLRETARSVRHLTNTQAVG